jgi:hypothetical protein
LVAVEPGVTGVFVDVFVGVFVWVFVGVLVGVSVCVGVAVHVVGAAPPHGVAVAVFVAVFVGVAVDVGDGVSVAVGDGTPANAAVAPVDAPTMSVPAVASMMPNAKSLPDFIRVLLVSLTPCGFAALLNHEGGAEMKLGRLKSSYCNLYL